MNILIVDDQPKVLAALTHSIDWAAIGIQHVYTASSTLSGKQILQEKDIQLLLTDIEMPVENGLSLIRWARSNHIPVEAILLTSHANFYYAKEAIALDVVDYVMQPARNEDVIQAILHAQDRIQQKRNVEEKLKINEFSLYEQNLAARRFLEHWPAPVRSAENDALLAQKVDRLNALGVSCRMDSTALLFLCQIDQWFTIPDLITDWMGKYQQMIKEIFSFLNTLPTSYYRNESQLVSLCFPSSVDDLDQYFQILIQKARTESQCSLSIYYMVTSLYDLQPCLNLLTNLDELNEPKHQSVIEQKYLIKEDTLFQSSQQYQKYFDQIDQYITQNIREPISRSGLAEHLHLSPDYISHIVRVMKNCSCKEWITRRKMNFARQMIQTTNLPIGEIAAQCGYDSFAYFSKVYKLYFNTTPRNDRAGIRDNETG